MRFAVKPTSSILSPRQSIRVDGSPVEVAVLMRGLPDFATGVSVAQNVAVATSDALAALR